MTTTDEMGFISEDGEPQIQTDEMGPNIALILLSY